MIVEIVFPKIQLSKMISDYLIPSLAEPPEFQTKKQTHKPKQPPRNSTQKIDFTEKYGVNKGQLVVHEITNDF